MKRTNETSCVPVSAPVHHLLPLEARCLFTAALTANGTLKVTGTSIRDSIVVRAGAEGTIIVQHNGIVTSFDNNAVRRVHVSSAGGDDNVWIRVSRRSTVVGGNGNDAIRGGRSDDILSGGRGDDTIASSDGNDVLYAGPETDIGFDVAYYSREPAAVRYEGPTIVAGPSDRPDAVVTRDGKRDLLGTNFDRFVATPFADRLDSADDEQLSGAELLGGDGNDTFTAGAGADQMYGGAGGDTFEFIEGNRCRAYGEDGDDLFDKGEFAPYLFEAGAGDDTFTFTGELRGGGSVQTFDLNDEFAGLENILSLAGPAIVIGSDSDNVITVAPQFPYAVTLRGNGGNDSLVGGSEGDVIDGGDGDDTLRGGEGDDTLSGGGGRDRLYGDAGDDVLLARGGSRDRVDGGSGFDTATADTLGSVIDLLIDVEAVS